MTTVPISDARKHLADIGNRTAIRGDRIVVERRGKNLFAIVPVEDLQLLELLEAREDLDLIRERMDELDEPWEKVKADLGI